MSAVANNITKHDAKRNTQPSLWDIEPEAYTLEDFPLERDLPFRWGDNDTSEPAAQRMLAHIAGKRHVSVGYEFVNGHLITYYADVLSTRIENGVVWASCTVWPEGKLVDEMRGKLVDEGDEDEDDEDGEPDI